MGLQAHITAPGRQSTIRRAPFRGPGHLARRGSYRRLRPEPAEQRRGAADRGRRDGAVGRGGFRDRGLGATMVPIARTEQRSSRIFEREQGS